MATRRTNGESYWPIRIIARFPAKLRSSAGRRGRPPGQAVTRAGTRHFAVRAHGGRRPASAKKTETPSQLSDGAMIKSKPAKAPRAKPDVAKPMQLGAPDLTCYPLWPDPPPLVPGRPERLWMDMTSERYAYRCIPLSMANTSGWEIQLPFGFEASWDGSYGLNAIQLRSADPRLGHMVTSHFGHGVITFHTGWLMRTSPGWAIWARGAPNWVKDGIVPLDGLVETDWLPFPFTMNWRFTRPGSVGFSAGEAFCFVTPVPHVAYDGIEPVIRQLADDPQ